jgi:hypothetical protein
MENETSTCDEQPQQQENSEKNNNGNSWVFLKSFFLNNHKTVDGDAASASANNQPKAIPNVSLLANSVICRCSKILGISVDELQYRFDTELPRTAREPSCYARNLLEFCSYKALHKMTERSDYLSDKNFRCLTYDMMLAWECPGIDNPVKDNETTSCSNQEVEDEDGWSLFYSNSTNMAVQVDDKKTVGLEAFSRIAPACAVVADIITVHNLFDSLTSSSSYRLHFLIYDKYLRSLDKVIKSTNNTFGPQLISNNQLADGEIILDIDGSNPTQPVLQHVGMSAWPGRLTLTNRALYFESLGVGLYDKAVRYDLETDLKQTIKPELTGPLGARLFDKAVMYKSTAMADPIYLEFPEFKGNSRRDYWLDICVEILQAHKFIRKYNLNEIQQTEALARATLGIFRSRAVREAFQIYSSQYKTLLCFNLAESLPRGDKILETLSSRLALLNPSSSRQSVLPYSLLTLYRLKILTRNDSTSGVAEEVKDPVGDICVGETNPLEDAVNHSKRDICKAEAAQATVDQVKVEGIDTNLAVMKELLFPFIESCNRLQFLASWEDPIKSALFLILVSYIICGWVTYVLPTVFLSLAVMMLWRRHSSKGRPLEAFKITAPPNRNAVEQLLTLQEAISQVEALIQSGNIVLLKLRALLFAALPQATDRIAILFVLLAMTFAFVPLKFFILAVFLEAFTRELPLRVLAALFPVALVAEPVSVRVSTPVVSV